MGVKWKCIYSLGIREGWGWRGGVQSEGQKGLKTATVFHEEKWKGGGGLGGGGGFYVINCGIKGAILGRGAIV